MVININILLSHDPRSGDQSTYCQAQIVELPNVIKDSGSEMVLVGLCVAHLCLWRTCAVVQVPHEVDFYDTYSVMSGGFVHHPRRENPQDLDEDIRGPKTC